MGKGQMSVVPPPKRGRPFDRRQPIITAFILVLMSITFGTASDAGRIINVDAPRAGTGILTFSDSGTYNSLDFGGNALGLLEKYKTPVHLDLAYRYASFNAHANSDSLKSSLIAGVIPRLTVGVPGSVFFDAWYAPYRSAIDSTTLGVQRFGFSLAGGASSHILSFGISGTGFLGELKRTGTSDHRHVLGVENLGLYVGSQVHHLVRIGFHGAVSGVYDSLSKAAPNDTTYDRYFSGAIPRLGGDIDFGGEGVPVRSNFALEWSSSRFMYATKLVGSINNADFLIDPMIRDSLNWNWQTIVLVPIHDFTIRPASTIGFWRSNVQVYDTISGNDNPMELGPEKNDTSWRVSSLHWGLGTGFTFRKWVDAGVEYTWSNMNHDVGSGYSNAPDKKQVHHRFAVGATGNLDAIPALRFPVWLQVAVRAGYLNMLGNAGIDAYRSSDFFPAYAGNPLALNTQSWRYKPDFGMTGYERITRFSLGLGIGLWERMLALDSYLAWSARESATRQDGFEFGTNLTYTMQ